MPKYQKGKIIEGTVSGIESYGIFVSFDEFYSGLIHISEVSHNFVKDLHDFVEIGENIYVEILDIDEIQNKLKLSIKNINYKKVKNGRKRKIIETSSGFKTLAYKLPIWIKENLEKNKNVAK